MGKKEKQDVNAD